MPQKTLLRNPGLLAVVPIMVSIVVRVAGVRSRLILLITSCVLCTAQVACVVAPLAPPATRSSVDVDRPQTGSSQLNELSQLNGTRKTSGRGEIIGKTVAADLASALRNLVSAHPGIPAIAVVKRPQGAFDRQLVEALQTANFKIYLATSASSDYLLDYRVERLISDKPLAHPPVFNSNLGNEATNTRYPVTDYRISMHFRQWTLSREYRVTSLDAIPISSMVLASGVRNNSVSSALPPDETSIENPGFSQ